MLSQQASVLARRSARPFFALPFGLWFQALIEDTCSQEIEGPRRQPRAVVVGGGGGGWRSFGDQRGLSMTRLD